VSKAGCLLTGILWVFVFGFLFFGLIMGDCPDAKEICGARDKVRWIWWWIAALGSFVGMIWYYSKSKGRS
jgi:hypothetical protein